ncbi:hypothetical protein PF007_g30006 [Phytophthora fragariae]|nr:hypothetical protein PF003_g13828 [Phytophthora fragariae]KAE8935487.1 hypothetical protein PF009_g14568 [Phytophthora fragariae]KAE9062183.1 hypothetical protein PF007_g30006 [Phytophthora fragariae]KAE9274904.1 hypothetical protein PF001_g26846 [Phytophthora fragariae]
MPCPTDPECARSAPEQLQQAPVTLLPDGPVPRSERRSTQASGATVDETRAPAELMPDLRHLQQPTSPATKANQPAESQLNATETKTKVAEASDGSSSSMSSSPADTASKTTKKKDPVLANTEPKDSKLIKTLLQRAMKRPLQRSSPEKLAVKLVKPDVQTASSQRRQSPQPTKATKQNGSTYLPGVAGEAQTASWPDNRDWHASSPEKPWWNTAAEGTARIPGVTCWNSKYSVWVIDLTQEYLSDSGLTSKITRSYGVKDECGASEQKVRTARTTMAARALRMTAPRRR